MTAAGEVGGQEHLDAFLGDFHADQPGAEREHVGVVVLACQPGAGAVMAQRGADMAVTVEGDRNADAGAADGDAASGPALAKRPGEGIGVIGIVDRFPVERA